MNIIGDILGLTIESYGDHYLGLHSTLAMMCRVVKISKLATLALFFIVILNMDFCTSRADAHNPMNHMFSNPLFLDTKIKLSKHSNGC
jgi:hypothetical protein